MSYLEKWLGKNMNQIFLKKNLNDIFVFKYFEELYVEYFPLFQWNALFRSQDNKKNVYYNLKESNNAPFELCFAKRKYDKYYQNYLHPDNGTAYYPKANLYFNANASGFSIKLVF